MDTLLPENRLVTVRNLHSLVDQDHGLVLAPALVVHHRGKMGTHPLVHSSHWVDAGTAITVNSHISTKKVRIVDTQM